MDGIFEIKNGDEDIHTANERRLKVCMIVPIFKFVVIARGGLTGRANRTWTEGPDA